MSPSSVVMLPYALASVAAARRRLSSDLLASGIFSTTVDDAVLVVSELLSNALRHAHPLPSGQLRLTWTCSEGRLEVAVSDGGATTEPRAGRPTLSSLGGRGLGIVEYLSERWGVRHEGETTTVWAILTLPQPVRNGQTRKSEIHALQG
ncbi:hypothetical protein Misp02_63020 [Microtetraspora sp. NBRC 16547]|nr:hypothetical protein Misp02_63020 [Microtetraspora sp. NBRC 16547]